MWGLWGWSRWWGRRPAGSLRSGWSRSCSRVSPSGRGRPGAGAPDTCARAPAAPQGGTLRWWSRRRGQPSASGCCGRARAHDVGSNAASELGSKQGGACPGRRRCRGARTRGCLGKDRGGGGPGRREPGAEKASERGIGYFNERGVGRRGGRPFRTARRIAISTRSPPMWILSNASTLATSDKNLSGTGG